MAKITFLGVPGEPHESLFQYGVNFVKGKAVDVGNMERKLVEKLKRHPHFSVDDDVTDVESRAVRPEQPPVDDAFIAVGSNRLDGKVQTEESLKAAEAAYRKKAKPTRGELEQTASALGVKYDDKTSDEQLIADSEKAAAKAAKK